MVYCGKPSMGCRTCRARRIKCDETRPVCNQCIKSRRHCSGYRSDFDILHRDETQATAARAKKAAAKKAAKRAADNGETIISFDDSESVPGPSSRNLNQAKASESSANTGNTRNTRNTGNTLAFPVATPTIPLDQHASHYFASNFIMVAGDRGRKAGHLEFLLPLLDSETNPTSPIRLAYSACAFAAMGNRLKADTTSLPELSFMQHSRALLAVHNALQDPVQSKSDSTLATVLLLSLFERITATQEVGMKGWRTHIEGAMQIVRCRGRDMVQNRTSVLLFNAVRLEIIARTLSSGTAPVMGVNWWVPESVAADSVAARHQRFTLETTDLRVECSRLMSCLPHNDQGLEIMLEMLRKVQDLDHQIANWLNGLPAEYQPAPLYWEDGPIRQGQIRHTNVFPGRVDVYHDLLMASMYNSVRSARIMLMSLLIRVAAWICSPADYRSTPEYTTAVRKIKSNIAGIISSVPYLLGMLPPRRHQIVQSGTATGTATASGGFACGSDEQSKMMGGLMVAWPLSTVRTCDFTSDEQRDWTIGRLSFIATELGMKYASSLAAAEIRFPSMLIRRDGLLPTQDPLKDLKSTMSTTLSVR